MSSDTIISRSRSVGALEQDAAETELRVRWLRRLDRFGIGLSGVCAVHCAFMPLLMLALPFVGGHEFEGGLRLALGGIGVFAVAVGYSLHRRAEVGLWLLVALVLFAALSAVDFTLTQEVLVSIVASGALIRAHWLNSRACRSAAGGACNAQH